MYARTAASLSSPSSSLVVAVLVVAPAAEAVRAVGTAYAPS